MRSPFLSVLILGLSALVMLGCGTRQKATGPDPEEQGPAWFEDVTDKLGIDFEQDPGPIDGTFHLGQVIGSGVAVFDLEQKKLRWQGPMLQCAPATLCFSPDSKRLAIGTVEVILTNAANGAPLGTTFRGHRGLVTALAFRPDGLRLASGSTDSTVLIWDCQP